MMKAKKLKLYVWENVLVDWTPGMAVALAPDLETALSMLRDRAGYDLDLPISNLKVINVETPFATYVHGGG